MLEQGASRQSPGPAGRVRRRTMLRNTAAAVALVAIGAAGAELLLPHASGAQSKTSETYKQLDLFGDVFERVRADYVEPVTDEQIVEYAINGMLTSLDPHSSYLNPKNYSEMKVQTKGEFGGLGIEVTMEQGLVKVVTPIDDTPAFRAGIKPGDLISQINGEPVSGLSLGEAVDKMKGPINSDVKLTVIRGGKDPFDVTLSRAVIKIESVRSQLVGDIGYIRITQFTEQTGVGLTKAWQKLKDASATTPMKGIVMDLRNNPGGLLDQCVFVSDAFLDKGEIVSTRGRRPEETQRFNAKSHDISGGLPMVALINGGSASCSEIVAGALQDHHRAIVMGTRSFGKGSVQTIVPLPNNGAMRLTTARYYTPSGRSIQGKGIEPDIEVPAAKLEVIDEPAGRHEADLKGALRNTDPAAKDPSAKPGAKPEAAKPEAANGAKPAADPAAKPETETPPAPPSIVNLAVDYQLSRALDLIHGISLYNVATKAGN